MVSSQQQDPIHGLCDNRSTADLSPRQTKREDSPHKETRGTAARMFNNLSLYKAPHVREHVFIYWRPRLWNAIQSVRALPREIWQIFFIPAVVKRQLRLRDYMALCCWQYW